MQSLKRISLLFVLAFLPQIVAAQSVSNSPSPSSTVLVPVTTAIARTTPVPHRPAEILKLAAAMNGLAVPSTKPWRVKLTWDQFDEDGDNIHSGTFDEYYVDSKKYRRTYVGDTLNQTEAATESGLYRSGDQRWPTRAEMQIRSEALQPLYLALRDQPNVRLDKINWQFGSSKLPCIILRRTDVTISDNGLSKFCFEPGTVLLRYTRGSGWDETFYSNFVLFQDRYVPLNIEVTQAGKAYLKINVEELESVAPIDDSLLKPPPGSAGRIAERVSISSDILMRDYLVSTAMPSYPRGTHGKVTVKFVVGKDGRVIQADAEDGPAELRGPAVEAIRKYHFRPFLVLGQPVEVESGMFFDLH